MLVIKQLMVPIDFHNISFPTMEVIGDQQLFGSSKFFRIFSFVFGTTLGWVNDDTIFILGEPFL